MYRKYLNETTIHGLKYLYFPSVKALERVFWFVTILAAWIYGAWTCWEVWSQDKLINIAREVDLVL